MKKTYSTNADLNSVLNEIVKQFPNLQNNIFVQGDGKTFIVVSTRDGLAEPEGLELFIDNLINNPPPTMTFNGVRISSADDVDRQTIKRVLNVIRSSGDDWLKINAQMRELMLAVAALIVIVKVVCNVLLTAEQKTQLKTYIEQLDNSLTKAQAIAVIRDEGSAFKSNNQLT